MGGLNNTSRGAMLLWMYRALTKTAVEEWSELHLDQAMMVSVMLSRNWDQHERERCLIHVGIMMVIMK